MIGKIIYDEGEIVIEDDGTVICEDPTIKRMVEVDLAVYNDTYSPAMGVYGVSLINALAEEMGGKADIPQKEQQGDKNTIY